MKRKSVFFSHTWKTDSLNRDNHQRVMNLAHGLKSLGWNTWVDEQSGDVHGCVDFALARAIEKCDIVAICLTEAYVKKIDMASSRHCFVQDNCLKEKMFFIRK